MGHMPRWVIRQASRRHVAVGDWLGRKLRLALLHCCCMSDGSDGLPVLVDQIPATPGMFTAATAATASSKM